MANTLINTYARLPICFEKGEGAQLWDTDGNRYLDALSGIAVCSLGHAHPAVSEAICQQASKLVHTSNIYQIANQQALADELTGISGMDAVFFSNSGAEANEAAIKLARLYGHNKGIEDPTIIVMENSFHGRTMATLSATGNRKIQAGFEPLVHGFSRVPYNDLEAIRNVAANMPKVVAILVEPAQGEGGVNIPDDDYLAGLREICDQNDWLLMLDEIQTGMGRTGEWFAYQHTSVVPDILTVAKALGNGVPIGACLVRGPASDVFQPGNHGSTYGGNPLACAAGLAVIKTMRDEKLVSRAASLGERITNKFRDALIDAEGITDIRNKGLMIGIELDRPCSELVSLAMKKGLLINVTAEKVIRLLPPFILSDDEVDELVSGLSAVIKTFLKD